MFFLLLLGLGLAVGAAAGGDPETDEASSDDVARREFDDDEQFIVSEDSRDEVETGFDGLVRDNILTDAARDTAVAEIEFIDGPMNIDTAGGDDIVLASQSNDKIDAGRGDDLVIGGAGDDTVDLGDGDDVYAGDLSDFEFDPQETDALVTLAATILKDGDLGDDTIQGGAGNDLILDRYGANELSGGDGVDLMLAIDKDGVTPDVVDGGAGADILVVDEGDKVTTGDDADTVVVDLSAGVGSDYEVVTITDFDPTQDSIFLDDSTGLVLESASSGLDLSSDPAISVTETDDGTGAMISVNGTPVVILTASQGLTGSELTSELRG
ncbi:MAG: hypothetical protein AAGA08_09420 [Pseudomonadota bacterium]